MFIVDRLILIGALLLLFGILSSKFSARLGLPALVLFIGVGMLAGSEGIGGIDFENYDLAHGVGTVALAVILFDGGLRTSLSSFRAAWKPALALATVGVAVTAGVTGFAAAEILGLEPLQGLLLGAIVGSTDAAAVFSVLRSQGLRLPERVGSTIEIESGSNDPMAVFLTVGLLQVLGGTVESGPALLGLFAAQMGLGLAAGLAVGVGGRALINRIDLGAAGLYPVLTAAVGLLAYGLAASLGGSGFLAVYVAGVALGNSRLVFRRGTLLFHDGIAWIAQIAMFVLLGLLSFPSRLIETAPQALLIALILIFVARPLAVGLSLLPFRFRVREMAFIAWGGLRGAVPIILATFPLLFGVAVGGALFDVVFFVVLVSAFTQGWSLPVVAKRLGLLLPAEPEPPVTLEITSLKDVDGDIVEYTLGPRSRAAGRRIRDLAFPDGVVVAMIAREHRVIPPRGSTLVEPGDHLFVVIRPDARSLVDRLFAEAIPGGEPFPIPFELPLRGDTTVRELEEFYGISLEEDPSCSLSELLQQRVGDGGVQPGECVRVGTIVLYARELGEHGAIERVGLAIVPQDEA